MLLKLFIFLAMSSLLKSALSTEELVSVLARDKAPIQGILSAYSAAAKDDQVELKRKFAELQGKYETLLKSTSNTASSPNPSSSNSTNQNSNVPPPANTNMPSASATTPSSMNFDISKLKDIESSVDSLSSAVSNFSSRLNAPDLVPLSEPDPSDVLQAYLSLSLDAIETIKASLNRKINFIPPPTQVDFSQEIDALAEIEELLIPVTENLSKLNTIEDFKVEAIKDFDVDFEKILEELKNLIQKMASQNLSLDFASLTTLVEEMNNLAEKINKIEITIDSSSLELFDFLDQLSGLEKAIKELQGKTLLPTFFYLDVLSTFNRAVELESDVADKVLSEELSNEKIQDLINLINAEIAASH